MSQTTIDLESEAGRLLRRVVDSDPVGVIIKTPISDEVKWLLDHEYIYKSGTYGGSLPVISVTLEGWQYYKGLCQNPAVTASPAAWKEEARSGIAVQGGPLGTVTTQSKIDRACIPGVETQRSRRTPEAMMQDMQRMIAAQEQLCTTLGITPDQLYQFGCEDRIKVCKGCESIGVFHRDRNGWKSKCRKCRKIQRGK